MSWYSDEWIEATVTHDYILKHLPKDRQQTLTEPLAFGQGLTDLTYSDWIVSRGQRLFSILLDIGCSERIFDLVDHSVDDLDLPFSQDDLPSLGLGNSKLAKKFYSRQFAYQVRFPQQGEHLDYNSDDVVPLDIKPWMKGPSGKPESTSFERVRSRTTGFTRWHISLGASSNEGRDGLIHYYKTLQKLDHPNISRVFATYTHGGRDYVLLSPCPEISLKTFLEEPPKLFKQMSKSEQLNIVAQWIRCLIGAIAYLHQKGWAHQAIRPSNIFVSDDNKIFLGPHAAIGIVQEQDPPLVKDIYQYGAPEQWERQVPRANSGSVRSHSHNRSASTPHARHGYKASQSSTSASKDGVALRFSNEVLGRARASVSASDQRASDGSTKKPGLRYSASFTNGLLASAAMERQSSLPTDLEQLTNYIIAGSQNLELSVVPASTPFESDVFSLSAVLVELLTFYAMICRSSQKYTSLALNAHLAKSSRTSTTSFHSNIAAVHIWLDCLVQLPEPSNTKTLPKLITKGLAARRSSWTNKNDLDYPRYMGLMASFIQIVRRGINTIPSLRFLPVEALAHADDTMRVWGIPTESCTCFVLPKQVEPAAKKSSSMSPVSPLSATIATAATNESRALQASPAPSEGTIEPSDQEPVLDPDFQLPSLSSSPSPLIAPSIDLPSRPPTPPPKEPYLLASPSKKVKPRVSPRIANSDITTEDALWLPPTPTSTLFHPTVYELAMVAWETDADTMIQETESLSSLDLFIFNHKDKSPASSKTKKTSSRTRNSAPLAMEAKHPSSPKKQEKAADAETVIIAFEDDFEIARKSGNAVTRTPTRSRMTPAAPRNKRPSGTHREKTKERRPGSSHRERARERRPSSSHREKAKERRPSSTKSQRRKKIDSSFLRERIRASSQGKGNISVSGKRSKGVPKEANSAEAWWGLDWGKWRTGGAGWQSVDGKDEEARQKRESGHEERQQSGRW